MTPKGQYQAQAFSTMGPTSYGYHAERLTTNVRCKSCNPAVRDTFELWELCRKARGHLDDGSVVTLMWIVRNSFPRTGVQVSEPAWLNHFKKHTHVKVAVGDGPILRTDREHIKNEVTVNIGGRREKMEASGDSYRDFLTDIVAIGHEHALADPAKVSVDHALAAAKELSKVTMESQRVGMLQMLAGRQRVGPVKVSAIPAAIEAEVIEDA